MNGLEEPGHRRADLDTAGAGAGGAAPCTRGSFIDDRDADLGPVHVDAHGIVAEQGDLVALAIERHGPEPAAHDLADLGGDGAIVDREAAIGRQLDTNETLVERDLVAHQRSPSSRAARAQAVSVGVAARRSVRDRTARTAASAPAAAAPSGRSPRSAGGQWVGT